MKKILLAALLVLSVSEVSFADEKQTVKITGTNAAGTDYSIDQKVKVDDKLDGTKKTTITTKAMNDPKGLFNKSKGQTKETITTDKNGAVIADKKVVSGKVIDNATAATDTTTK